MFFKTLEFKKKKDFLKQFDKFQKRSQLKHENIIQLKNLHIKVDEDIFNTSYRIYLFIDYTNVSLVDFLSKEKKNKLNPRLHFSLFEAFFVLNGLIKALKFMFNNQMVSSIQPENVFFTKKMSCKIADSQLFGFEDPIRKIRKNKKSLVYLAPEQLQEMSKHNVKEGIQKSPDDHFEFLDKKKIAIFQLGVILISLLLNESQLSLFDYKYKAIKVEMLQMQLNQISTLYNEDICNIVSGMVELDPLQRMEIQ